jgi:hypothetical protein
LGEEPRCEGRANHLDIDRAKRFCGIECEFSLGIRDRQPIKRIASILVTTIYLLDAVATDDGARDGPPRGVHHSPADPLLRHGDLRRRLHFHLDGPASGIDLVQELWSTTRPVDQNVES